MAFPDGQGNEFNIIFVHERSALSFGGTRGLQNNGGDEPLALCVLAKGMGFEGAHLGSAVTGSLTSSFTSGYLSFFFCKKRQQ